MKLKHYMVQAIALKTRKAKHLARQHYHSYYLAMDRGGEHYGQKNSHQNSWRK